MFLGENTPTPPAITPVVSSTYLVEFLAEVAHRQVLVSEVADKLDMPLYEVKRFITISHNKAKLQALALGDSPLVRAAPCARRLREPQLPPAEGVRRCSRFNGMNTNDQEEVREIATVTDGGKTYFLIRSSDEFEFGTPLSAP